MRAFAGVCPIVRVCAPLRCPFPSGQALADLLRHLLSGPLARLRFCAREHTHTHTYIHTHIRIICQAPSNRNIAPIISLADPGPHFYLHQFPHHSLVSLCPVSELTLHAGAVFAEIFPSRPALAIEPWLAVHVCSAARRALAAARYQIAVPNFC